MRSLTLHLKVLITVLVLLGVLVTAYQIFFLGIPVTEDETDDLWNIDAKVEFVASTKDPVKVQMFVPPLNRDYVSLNESFISNNYGVSVNRVDGNRKVTWSARRAKGNQTLADAWNKALAETMADGSYAAVSKKYFNEDVRCN